MSTLTVTAPAKINLSLRILGKREDGFHEVDTFMVKLPELCDHLEFSSARKFSFQCDDATLPTDENNLVVRAVRAYERAAKIKCGYAVTLKKIIPHSAGLGGGSSDAAAALSALNRLYEEKLSAATLLGIASALGSDVPFFLLPGAGRCQGRGDSITAAPCPPRLQVLLLKPCFDVSTPDVYARWVDSRELPGIRYAEQNLDGICLVNDLERPAFGKYRFLPELKQWLLERHEVAGALLCGSGSSIFSILHPDANPTELANAARTELDPHLWHWAGATQSQIQSISRTN